MLDLKSRAIEAVSFKKGYIEGRMENEPDFLGYCIDDIQKFQDLMDAIYRDEFSDGELKHITNNPEYCAINF